MTGYWANPGLSEGLKRQKCWWKGPVEVNLADLSPAVGPETGREYLVGSDYWDTRTGEMASSMTNLLSIPPLIVEYRHSEFSVRDGNTRLGAMPRLGWLKCWVIIWYNIESDYQRHNALLFES